MLFLFVINLQAQHAVFLKSGKVSFERKINMYAILPPFLKDSRQVSNEQIAAFMLQYKASSPQFLLDSFNLFFNHSGTVYKPASSDHSTSQTRIIPIPETNSIISDFTEQKIFSNKQLLDKSFFIADSIKSIKWKLTDEIREIAGFQCRRANALLFDSVYVVAFYAEEIPTKGGPGIFNGLPGMILGVALPHEHISIFATKVYSIDVSKDIEYAFQNKNAIQAVNNRRFNEEIEELLKKLMAASSWLKIMATL
ncbi:MAG: GLPGLI family protein [Candidatus Kuenenia stuttgartiensis]|nr:GLPGLI family protein [Candidatus Kuenenia stuttgartiensis]